MKYLKTNEAIFGKSAEKFKQEIQKLESRLHDLRFNFTKSETGEVITYKVKTRSWVTSEIITGQNEYEVEIKSKGGRFFQSEKNIDIKINYIEENRPLNIKSEENKRLQEMVDFIISSIIGHEEKLRNFVQAKHFEQEFLN
jgi:hypothetical protein